MKAICTLLLSMFLFVPQLMPEKHNAIQNNPSSSTLPGDANCDGIVNVLDLVASISHIMGENPQPFCSENADANGDGLINILDVVFTVNIILFGQNITISGQYLDKLSEPIANALVKFYSGGTTPSDSTFTDIQGLFSLAFTAPTAKVHPDIILQAPFTCPATGHISFVFSTGGASTITIRSRDGLHVDRLKLSEAGIYHCRWEGFNRIGQPQPAGAYLVHVQSQKLNTVHEASFSGKASGRISAERNEKYESQPAENTSHDRISFTRTNTTALELMLVPVQADTTLGIITGNIGPTATSIIGETRFSIEGTLQWNLNNYFHNDDQSIYTLTGSSYNIVNQHWLQLQQPALGSYNTAITATDPQDATLTAQTTAAVDVEYTIALPEAFSIPEDAPAGTLVADFSQYVNPACTYSFAYTLLSNSNPGLITFSIQGAQLLADSLQPDGYGQSAVSVLMENLSGSGADTLWFDVNVLPMTDVYGTITDILDSTLIAGATVYIFSANLVANNVVITDTVAVLTTNANGAFHFQFAQNPNSLTYFFVRIEKYGSALGEGSYVPYHSWLGVNPKDGNADYPVALIPDELADAYRPRKATAPRNNGDYTPRHTWLTVNPGGADVEINYTIFLQNQIYELYNRTMRDAAVGMGFPTIYSDTTKHWVSPPLMHLINDTTAVPGQNINVQFANLVYNAQNILPTFNPRDAKPENVVIHQSFGHVLQDNEKGAYFDDSISGAGEVTRIYAGPRMNKCITKYRWFIGLLGPDISTFNQELGSCFGAVLEPPQSPNYVSVFTDPAGSSSYTSYDFEIAKLYLDRNKIHYRNLTYPQSDSNGWDWEARPDIVEEWYTPSTTLVNTHMEIIVYGFEGEVTERTIYAYESIPAEVMEQNPLLFTAEDIAVQRIREENGHNSQPLYLWRKGEGIIVDCGCDHTN